MPRKQQINKKPQLAFVNIKKMDIVKDFTRKKPAKVLFIGNEEDYRINHKCESSWYYCHQCPSSQDCGKEDSVLAFSNNQEYDAYFVEFWQGERNSLHVRNNLGEVIDFVPLSDFRIISDEDNLLNFHTAHVKCITERHSAPIISLEKGEIYTAIGITDGQFAEMDYLVMDRSCDCYLYPAADFEIVSDPFNILNPQSGQYVYWWR